ncbi:hypothetical protein ACKKBF_B17100 [Auxenochlorella protothecoides x Auxenochlorella symbiontica]
MGSDREVVTLQFGSLANHVGTQYWNMQESWAQRSSDGWGLDTTGVLYSEISGAQGSATYHPRLVLCDASGSLGRGWASTSGTPNVQADDAATQTWLGQTHCVGRVAADEGAQQSFTSLAEWHPHPRSTQLIPGVWQGVSPFSAFSAGTSDALPAGFREGLVDVVRSFVEDCDCPQGLQALVDDQSGFGGLAAATLAELKEDLALPVAIFCVRDAGAAGTANNFHAPLNAAMSYAQLAGIAEVYATPTAPARLTFTDQSVGPASFPFPGTNCLAAALFNCSLPYVLGGISAQPPPASVSGTLGTLRQVASLLTSANNSPLTGLAVRAAVGADPCLDMLSLAPAALSLRGRNAELATWSGAPGSIADARARLAAALAQDASVDGAEPGPSACTAIARGLREADGVAPARAAQASTLTLWWAGPAFADEARAAQGTVRRALRTPLASDAVADDAEGILGRLEELRLAFSSAED